MVNTWKNIHKKDIFWNQYKQYKKILRKNRYNFYLLEKYKWYSIYYEKYHKIYTVDGYNYHFKTIQSLKLCINRNFLFKKYNSIIS